MKINYKDIGLHKNYLYETLATTFIKTKDKIIPNTASMGIRLIDDSIIKMSPYPNTKTYHNLKENGFISINFVDDINLFTLATLKDPNSSIGLNEFPIEYYGYHEFITQKDFKPILREFKDSEKIEFPYIKTAWAIFFCEVIEENQIMKENKLGKSLISEFRIKIFSILKKRESFKLFNRAENLILEILILASRLKLVNKRKDQQLFDQIDSKLKDYKKDIERFTENENVIKSLHTISKFIDNLGD